MNKVMLKADRLFIESYIAQKYPPCTHDLNLDMSFDDVGITCSQFLNGKKNIVLPKNLLKEEMEEIEEYIENNKNEQGQDTLIFYLMTKTAILILKRHYNLDGIRKY